MVAKECKCVLTSFFRGSLEQLIHSRSDEPGRSRQAVLELGRGRAPGCRWRHVCTPRRAGWPGLQPCGGATRVPQAHPPWLGPGAGSGTWRPGAAAPQGLAGAEPHRSPRASAPRNRPRGSGALAMARVWVSWGLVLSWEGPAAAVVPGTPAGPTRCFWPPLQRRASERSVPLGLAVAVWKATPKLRPKSTVAI